MMTLWCMFRSPLMIGAELTKLSDEDMGLLTNKTLLSFMEDGFKARQVARDDNHAIWVTEDKLKGKKGLAVFNLSEDDIYLKDYLKEVDGAEFSIEGIEWIDIWTGETVSLSNNSDTVIKPHGVCALAN